MRLTVRERRYVLSSLKAAAKHFVSCYNKNILTDVSKFLSLCTNIISLK